jgi:hypothetical protein
MARRRPGRTAISSAGARYWCPPRPRPGGGAGLLPASQGSWPRTCYGRRAGSPTGRSLRLQPAPEVRLPPSVIERFARYAPGLTGVTRWTLRTCATSPGRSSRRCTWRTRRCPGRGPRHRIPRRRPAAGWRLALSPSLGLTAWRRIIQWPYATCWLAVRAGLEDAAWFCFNGDFGKSHWQVPFWTSGRSRGQPISGCVAPDAQRKGRDWSARIRQPDGPPP